MYDKFKDYPMMNDRKSNVSLFYPHIPKNAIKSLKKILSGRWIGPGPLIDLFEKKIQQKFTNKFPCVAVGSGTDALHLSYILAGIKKNDEVICLVFTCTATNIPLIYIGAKMKFLH